MQLLKEPLLHFLLAGGLLFLLLSGDDGAAPDRTILVTQDDIAAVTAQFQRTWQRPPTAGELEGQIDQFIREEIYVREAKLLGLNENDTVIRRRLRAKMEFLARAQIEAAQPSDEILQAWLDDHAEDYRTGNQLSFDQIYLGGPADALKAMTAFGAGTSPDALGQEISLPERMENASSNEVAKAFGSEFATAIGVLPPGNWEGPVTSGFGQHLVRLRNLTSGTVPPLADIRQQVENDWRAATANAREDAAFQILREAYDITVEGPK